MITFDTSSSVGTRCKDAGRDASPGSMSSESWACCIFDACTLGHRREPHDEISRKAGCRKSARPVVCPAKAGMFSRGQTCRGKSQSPVVWIAEVMETETLKPIDEVFLGKAYESPGRNKSERIVASKMSIPEGRAFNRRAKAA